MRLSTLLVPAALLLAVPVQAQEDSPPPPAAAPEPAPAAQRPASRPQSSDEDWDQGARFFAGVRSGVAIPPGSRGVAPTLGFELGVSAPKGLGFGLHFIGMGNPPGVPALRIPKAEWGLGALADLRMYFQSIEPLTLYATLSAGFLAGPGVMDSDVAGQNVVLPLVNPGFGARVKLTDSVYTAFEFGLAGFHIPFVAVSFGWEPPRRK
jgi:hypothetical protein